MKKTLKLKDVEIDERDLNLLELYVVCIPLCQEHKPTMSEDMWMKCKKCDRIRERWRNGAGRVMAALFDVACKQDSED